MGEFFNGTNFFEINFNCLCFLLTFRRLLGVITKKDVLRHVKEMNNEDANSILFN